MSILRDNLSPMDFADADCRVTEWKDFDSERNPAVRIWACKCTNHWFQRHEWQQAGKNSTDMEEWIYSGYFPNKKFERHFLKELPL